MDSQHTEQVTMMEKNLDKLGQRFDRHLEIYAQNGKELSALKAEVAGVRKDIVGVRTDINHALGRFTTKEAFLPVRAIVFGLVGLILTAVAVAITSLVLV